uniref:Uncharacterized protein n=1 Tax=Anguilla anguilla TaxID=7936 RepID=A0A0E9TL38_ANGAN
MIEFRRDVAETERS